MKKILLTTLIALLIIFAHPVTSHASNTMDNSIDDYTIIIYLNGSTLESNYDYVNKEFRGNATKDLEEMIAGYQGDSNINIVVQTIGTKRWNNDFVSNTETQRFHLTTNGFELQYSTSPQNVGYKKGLSDFIKWSQRNYPANKYGLILWNHGGGPVKGFGADEFFNGDALHLEELDGALETAYASTGMTFEFIGFDACLMASLEVAHILEPYANYLLASEELEPTHGWNYEALLNELHLNPTMTGDALGRVVADSYLSEANEKGESYNITFSVVDLSKVEGIVNSLETLLAEATPLFDEPKNFYTFAKAVGKSRSFGGNSAARGYTDLIDLKDFGQHLQSDLPLESAPMIQHLDEAVVYKIDGSHSKNTGGLSLYFPLKDKDHFKSNMTYYKKFDFSKAYLTFLYHFNNQLNTLSGDNEIGYKMKGPGKKSDFYTIEFDDEDKEKIANVFLSLYLLNDNDEYTQHTYQSLGYDQLAFDDESGGYYNEVFDKEWLYLDDALLRLTIINDNDLETEYESIVKYNGERMYLSFSYDKTTNNYAIHGLRRGRDPVTGKPDKELYQLKPGDTIQPMYKMLHEKRRQFEWLEGQAFTVSESSEITKKHVEADNYIIAFRYYDFSYQYYLTEYFKFER